MTTPPPAERLRELLAGYWVSQALSAAAELGLADLLAGGPRAAADLAADAAADADAVRRLLRALASVGVFAEDGGGRFALTPTADLLRAGVPGSQRDAARMRGGWQYRAWGELLACVRSGRPAFERLFGAPVFHYLAARPAEAAVFDGAMVGVHGRETDAMLAAYDFAGVGTLADVGGGNGSLLTAVLRRYPGMRGVLFDLPGVAARAAEEVRRAGLADRCRAVGGSFLDAVPEGADAYLLRHVLHDWDDGRAAAVLRNVRAALPPGGRVLVVETVIPPGNGPSFGKLLDLNMLVLFGGRERTEAEFRRLFAAAGLEVTGVVPTAAGVDVVEGRAAG
jgi:hypothetical protein